MADVLEEVTGAISREHVEARLEDWEQRIRHLYVALKAWLPVGWTAVVDEAGVPVHEGIMREVGILERRLPLLNLHHHDLHDVTVEPRVLWILGANGRLVVRSKRRNLFISDKAELFEPPNWRITDLHDRSRERVLDKSSFRDALA